MMMLALLQIAHLLAGVVVLVEALNKLERCNLRRRYPTVRVLVLSWLHALAWIALALGAAGALMAPLLRLDGPSLQDVLVLCGFAAVVLSERLRRAPIRSVYQGPDRRARARESTFG